MSSPASSLKFDTPDPFWKNQQHQRPPSIVSPDHSSSHNRSPSFGTSSSIGTSPRKLSRKLPPQLTESLENIVTPSSAVVSRSSSVGSAEDAPLNVTLAIPVVESKSILLPPADINIPFVLSVAPPTSEFGATPALASFTLPASPKSPGSSLRKHSIARGSISGPILISDLNMPSRTASNTSTMSSPASSKLLTPRSSSHMNYSRPLSADSIASSSPTSCSSLSRSSGSASTCGTWSVLDELELQERLDGGYELKESKKERKLRKRIEEASFDENTSPTMKQLFEAGFLEVVGEQGERVKFGDLVGHRKTVVIFIRHWFCPLCAQYINSILSQVKYETLEAADVDLVIIGNGSDKMIHGYRNKHFKCPFKMYTDPALKLYRALGLTRQTSDGGDEEEKGDYLTQSALESTVQTIKRATQMPLRRPGHFTQIGGEFVFDGPLNCVYTHRMTTTRDHSPIRDVVAHAGVQLEFIHYEPGPPPPPVHRSSYLGNSEDNRNLDNWQDEREAQLARIKALKESRRSGRSTKSSIVARTKSDRSTKSVRGVKIVGTDDADLVVNEFGQVSL